MKNKGDRNGAALSAATPRNEGTKHAVPGGGTYARADEVDAAGTIGGAAAWKAWYLDPNRRGSTFGYQGTTEGIEAAFQRCSEEGWVAGREALAQDRTPAGVAPSRIAGHDAWRFWYFAFAPSRPAGTFSYRTTKEGLHAAFQRFSEEGWKAGRAVLAQELGLKEKS
jgi:hypothetical protein